MNEYAVDDDIWLNVERLHSFLKEISKESEEYKTNYISGYVNQYYLDVARPGSQTNKVLIKFEIKKYVLNSPSASESDSSLDVSRRKVPTICSWFILHHSHKVHSLFGESNDTSWVHKC